MLLLCKRMMEVQDILKAGAGTITLQIDDCFHPTEWYSSHFDSILEFLKY